MNKKRYQIGQSQEHFQNNQQVSQECSPIYSSNNRTIEKKGLTTKRTGIVLVFLLLFGVILIFCVQESLAASLTDESLRNCEIDCSLYTVSSVWSSSTNIITTRIISVDINRDGMEELLFGTKNGEIIAMQIPEKNIILEYSLGLGEVYSIIAANIDNDPGYEILVETRLGMACEDYEVGVVQWYNPNVTTRNGLKILDADNNGFLDILSYSNTFIYKLDTTGNVSMKVPVMPVNNERGILTMTLSDVDSDQIMEIVVTDYGYSWISEPGLPKLKGHHIWIIDSRSGDLQTLVTVPSVIFTSNPVVFSLDTSFYIAVALHPDTSGGMYDLAILNIPENSSQVYEIDNKNGQIEWKYLFLGIPSMKQSEQLILCSEGGLIYSFMFPEISISWHQSVKGILDTPFSSDIDSDGNAELLVPSDSIQIIEMNTGEAKGEIIADETNSKKDIEFTIGRFRGFASDILVYGYNNTISVPEYTISIITSPSVTINRENNSLKNRVIYPGISSEFFLVINNMTKKRIHSPIGFEFINPSVGIMLNTTLRLDDSINKSTSNSLINFSAIQYEFFESSTIIYFNLSVPWTNNNDEFNGIYINVSTNYRLLAEELFQDAFIIERHLKIVGNPRVYSPTRGILNEQSWVRKNESMEIDNFTVIFKNSIGLSPDWDSFKILLTVGYRQEIFDLSGKKEYKISTLTPDNGMVFLIYMAIIEQFTDITQESLYIIELRIDWNSPIVISHYPSSDIWNSQNPITCAIQLFDNESGININTLYYQIYSNNTELNGKTKIEEGNTFIKYQKTELVVEIRIDFMEGINYVIWSYADNVSNSGSFNQTVKLDLTNIVFKEFNPKSWISHSDVLCSITIIEQGGSGIENGSIQVAYAIENIFSFSNWRIADFDSSISNIAHFTIVGINGGNNFVKFRGKDIASTHLVESSIYTVMIDLLPPKLIASEPKNNTNIGPLNKHISLVINDDESGISNVTIELIEGDGYTRIDSILNILKVNDNLWHVNISFSSSNRLVKMYAKYVDNVGHVLENEDYVLIINQPPRVEFIEPRNNEKLYVTRSFNVSVNVSDIDGDQLLIEWFIDNVSLQTTSEIINQTLYVPGYHSIKVIVRDPYYIIQKELNVTLNEIEDEEKPTPNPSRLPLFLELLLIILIIIVCLLIFRSRFNNYKGV